ncbi:hypothetical protein APY03_1331 [Variovorax sp. WDL1]|nr:hypothetical protein APY03_1331 [Variovorax sp. WDL1]
MAVLPLVVGEELDLHLRHVDAGRAVALAALAADAQVHGVANGVAGEGVGAELARERQAQRVGAPAREVLLVARDAVAGAHGAGVELAAVAVVVAHLDGLGEAAGDVAAGAGRGGLLGHRIGLHVPGGPVEHGGDGDALVRPRRGGGGEAEEGAVVHLRRVDDLAGVEEADRVQLVLDGAEGLVDRRAELPLDPLAAAQAVAVLAAEGALVLAHQLAGFLGDGAHLRGAVDAHVENGPHVQRAHRCMGIPGAARAVLREDLGEAVGVGGQVLERHGAVLDEADRLAVALEAHHDVEAGLAHLPQVLLRGLLGHAHHAVGQAQVAHQLGQLLQLAQQGGAVPARELDQQDGGGLADQRLLDGRLEGRVGEAQLDHRAVDQLDGGGAQLHDVLGRIHCGVEAREVDDAQHLGAGQLGKLQRQAAGVGQRSLGAYQQVGQVDTAVGGVGPLALVVEDVEVVAGDAPHHLGPALGDLGAVLPCQLLHVLGDAGGARAERGDGAEVHQFAVRQPGARAEHVVHHVAVGDRARAAGVVARHAAQRRLGAGGDIDREPQAVRLELRVEVVQHQARLDGDAALRHVELEHAPHVLAVVDHQRRAGGLAALAGAAAARQHRHLQVARDVDGGGDVALGLRHEHAHRHDLVDGGVGGVAAARGIVEQHFALGLGREAAREPGADLVGRQHGAGGLQMAGGIDAHQRLPAWAAG